MAQVQIQLPSGRGMERTVASTRANKDSFYLLQNMRQVRDNLGQLEQTPRCYLFNTFTQGTYYDAGSQTEPTASAVRFYKECGSILGTIKMTDYCARIVASNTQLKCLHMTTAPAADGVTKGCLLTVVNALTMSVTLGSSYDVEIDGTNTFKWRVNGGAYTTGVVIDQTSGNLIDSSTIRLYWLASTGFTVTDAFSWTRNDAVFASALSSQATIYKQIGNQVFFRRDQSRFSVIELGTVPYIRDVGYRPVYGNNLVFDTDHLNILGDSSNGISVQSSDLANFDNFVATDVNEADLYTPTNETDRAVATVLSARAGIVIQGRLFVFLTNGIFYADYAGLPVPYAFRFAFPIRLGSVAGNVLTKGDTVSYFYTDRELCSFNGVSVEVIFNFAKLSLTSPTKIVYNTTYKEISVVFEALGMMLTYNETSKTTHVRYVDFSTSGVTTIHVDSSGIYFFGTASRKTLREDVTFAQTPVYDSTDGAAYAAPTIITQVFGDATRKIETSPVFIATTVTSTASSYYSTMYYTKWTLSWYKSNDGIITGTPTSTAPNTWTTRSDDNQITAPRTDARYIAYQLVLSGTDGTKPPGATTLNSFETTYGMPDRPDVSR